MNQVQVRQVPVSSSTDAQRIVGSWFPSGYYGHFRAKSRADLCHYFRQLARPEPPKKFLDRQHAEASTHMFSQHDNRFKFEGDPLVRATQSGFGRRRSKNNIRGEFDPFFVSWVPKNVDRKHFVDNVKLTAYAEDYNHDSKATRILSEIQSKPVPNIETNRVETPSEPEVTVYNMTYRHGQPDEQHSKQTRRETYQRFLTTRTRLSQNKRHDRSPSVASCLVWKNSSDETAPPPPPPPPILTIAPLNDSLIRISVPMTLQPRNTSNQLSPRLRAHSAGARLMSTAPTQPAPPPVPTVATISAAPFQSTSMQTFRNNIVPMERPHTAATTTSREHFKGANFGLQKEIPPRAVTSFEAKHPNSMDSLISKYM